MGTPILHGRAPHRSFDLTPAFPEPGWAFSPISGLDRTGDVVTLGLMARPLINGAEIGASLPQWACPAAPVLVDLMAPSTGVVVARILIDNIGALRLYGVVQSGSWAYASTAWRALHPM